MEKSSKIFVAGHNGLVGSALMRTLKEKGFANLVYRSHGELDLTNQQTVERFFIKDEFEFYKVIFYISHI